MEIRSEKAGSAVLARVSGELDLDTARDFRARIDADLERFGSRDLLLDFSGVEFVDSSGLGAVLGRYKRVTEKGGRLAIFGCRPHVRRLLALSGLERVVEIYASLDETTRAWKRAAAAKGVS